MRAGPDDFQGAAVSPFVDEVLRSPAQALDPDASNFFEPRFGHDFARVRVHADAKAADSARALNARAYTVGRDIVFAQGQYQPATTSGRLLLAHELTHVVQQRGAALAQRGDETPSDAGASTATKPKPPEDSLAPLRLRLQRPLVQRQQTEARPRPSLRIGAEVRGRCELQTGVFFWHIVPGTGSAGGCFNVQIVFHPGRVRVIRAGRSPLSPALGAGWDADLRPIALVQTVASVSGSFGTRPEVDISPSDTDPFYGAELDRSRGVWGDEPRAVQGCSSLPRADTGTNHGRGSSFSRPGAYGAVINDSPMTNVNERKDFQTVPVVMMTGQPLASLTWAVEHNGSEAVVGQVACHEQAQPNVEFGTPGHGDVLPGFYTSNFHYVVDSFATDNSTLPSGASAVLDQIVASLTGAPPQTRQVILSGAATPDERDAHALSRARAESVAAYLISHGVDHNAIVIEAFGASFARQPFGTPNAGERNRRVQITLPPTPPAAGR